MVVPLEYGDFVVADKDGHTLGAERKTVNDFLSSISDGRLKRQIANMVERFSHRVILLEGGHLRTDDGMLITTKVVGGLPSIDRVTGWRSASFQGALWSLQNKHGFVVLPTADIDGSLEALRILHSRAIVGCLDG